MLALLFTLAAIFVLVLALGLFALGLMLLPGATLAAVTILIVLAFGAGLFLLVTSAGLMIAFIAAAVIALLVYIVVFRVHHLPLWLFGLRQIPAVPIILWEIPITIVRLLLRGKQMEQAQYSLSKEFTIAGKTAPAYSFMYGSKQDPSLTSLALEQPDQFSMSWTTFGNIYNACHDKFMTGPRSWPKSLVDRAEATRQFWPKIADYGITYNLVVLERVKDARIQHFAQELDSVWTAHNMGNLAANRQLYVIDMTLMGALETPTVKGFPRFTPATLTFLKYDDAAKTFTPFLIRVAGENGVGARYFDAASTDGAWLYALQAAKTSITVWGIWIGHVYHWHVVTAAMQMTMFKTLPRTHIVRQLLGRQSDYLIAFDEVLLFFWSFIGPPTSVNTGRRFLNLLDAFALGRNFFDDDPEDTLKKLGLLDTPERFMVATPWDQYPVVGYLMDLWPKTQQYVHRVVEAAYPNETDVAADDDLQNWISDSGDESEGNVRGLPPMTNKLNLERVLTSLIFRITVHGISRMNQVANPAHMFVANFPPCLQETAIPEPTTPINTRRLLEYLPRTGTIGEYNRFLYVFAYSTPYKPFIPLEGIDAELSFEGPAGADCNTALREYREDVKRFMENYARTSVIENDSVLVHQWALNIET